MTSPPGPLVVIANPRAVSFGIIPGVIRLKV